MYCEKILKNGIRFFGEQNKNARSVAVGIFVKAGSATEIETENGLSHFLEHMLFKGTKRRDYQQIAEDFDHLGVQSNAYTAKELTCYHIRVIDDKLYEALDVLTDMVAASTLPKEQVKKERMVILEEIAMTLDTPDDLLMEELMQSFFAGTALSKTILGPKEKIAAYQREDLFSYQEKYYAGKNIVVCAVGNFEEATLVSFLEEKLSDIKPGEAPVSYEKNMEWKPKKKRFSIERDIEQAHIGMAFPGASLFDENRFAYSIIATILGGNMSSRLFQKIREEMGAAYAVYAYPMTYSEAGSMVVYAGTSAREKERVEEAILTELKKIKKEGITQAELEYAKIQLSAQYVLGQESGASRLMSLGRNVLLLGQPHTESEVLAKINNISMQDIKNVLECAFLPEEAVTGIVMPKK